MDPFSSAGIVSGISGLLVFLILHHLWIKPIWFILPFGFLIAALGGLAVGRAYRELAPNLPPRPWTALALFALIAVILLPAILLAELRSPMFDISVPGDRLVISSGQAILVFVFELLVTATIVAGTAGWFIGRTRRAALATALAGLIFALGPGHNIPLVGGTPGVRKELSIMAIVIFVSALVLVELSHLLFVRADFVE
jgi:hypothetical protein